MFSGVITIFCSLLNSVASFCSLLNYISETETLYFCFLLNSSGFRRQVMTALQLYDLLILFLETRPIKATVSATLNTSLSKSVSKR